MMGIPRLRIYVTKTAPPSPRWFQWVGVKNLDFSGYRVISPTGELAGQLIEVSRWASFFAGIRGRRGIFVDIHFSSYRYLPE